MNYYQIVVLKPNKKLLSVKNIKVASFKEEFEKYKRACSKSYLRTEACFSWHFESTLEDLKKSMFVYTTSKKTLDVIKNNFNVIETTVITKK